MLVLNPVARPKEIDRNVNSLDELEGKRIGFLDNRWPSWQFLIEKAAGVLHQTHKVKEVNVYDIPLTSAAPDEVLNQAASECDLVVVGLGN